MKSKLLISAILLMVLTSAGLFAQELDAWEEGGYMAQVMEALTETGAAVLEVNTDYGYKDGICFLGAFMEEKETATWSFNVKSGVDYIIVAQGDEDVVDLDLAVSDAKGTLLSEDSETDNAPVVAFTAKEAGSYKLKLNLFDSGSIGSFCGVIILQVEGWSIPTENMYMSAYKSLVFGNELVKNGLNINYFNLTGQWCVYGAVVDEGKENGAWGISLGTGNIIAFCSGDEVSSDTDLYLLTEDGKKQLAGDEEVEEVSVVQYKTDAKSKYRLRMVNHTSEGPSFLMLSVFTY